MIARICDINTGITLFERKLKKGERGKFESFLSARGFKYEKLFDYWMNEKRGHTAVISQHV